MLKPALLSIAFLFTVSCQKSGRIFLEVEFDSAKTWRYLLGVDIKGKIVSEGVPQIFNSSLRTFLQGGLSLKTEKLSLLKLSRPNKFRFSG